MKVTQAATPVTNAPQASQAKGQTLSQLANGPQSASASAARDRAIAMLSGQSPVQDQNAISPEEMVNNIDAGGTDNRQIDTNVEDVEVTAESTEQVTEAKTETEVDPLSKQYAALAKRERQIRFKQQQAEQSLRAKEQEIAAREAALSAKDQEYKSGYISKAQFLKDPVSVMAETGLSYEQLTEQFINQGQRNPYVDNTIKALEDKIARLEAGREEDKTAQAASQEQSYKAALNQIRMDTKALVNADSSFEAIRATNSISDVVDLIEQTYKHEGVLLSVEEAAQQVEDYLLEEALKLTKLEKIKKRLAIPDQANAQKVLQPQTNQTQKPQMKTLTNAASASRPLTARERAIAAFKGEKI